MCVHYRRIAVAGLSLGVIGLSVALNPGKPQPWVPEVLTISAVCLTAGMIFVIMVLSLHFGSGRARHLLEHPQHAEPDQVPESPDYTPEWPHNARIRSHSPENPENPGHEVSS